MKTSLKSLSVAAVISVSLAAMCQASIIVANSSFDNPIGTTFYGPIDNWSQVPFPSGLGGFNYLSGENPSTGPMWDNGTVPGEGSTGKVGFIQVFPSVPTLSLEQTVAGFTPGGQYQLSYDENSRGGSSPLLEVLVDGNVVVAQHLDPAVGGANPFRVVTSAPFTVSNPSSIVEFRVSQVNPGNDSTALIDHVSILSLSVPEPSTFVLLAFGGMGVIGWVKRNRKNPTAI